MLHTASVCAGSVPSTAKGSPGPLCPICRLSKGSFELKHRLKFPNTSISPGEEHLPWDFGSVWNPTWRRSAEHGSIRERRSSSAFRPFRARHNPSLVDVPDSISENHPTATVLGTVPIPTPHCRPPSAFFVLAGLEVSFAWFGSPRLPLEPWAFAPIIGIHRYITRRKFDVWNIDAVPTSG